MTHHVFINGFWEGFLERTNGVHFGFFEHVLTKSIGSKVIVTQIIDLADILLESHFAPSVLSSKRWTYSIFFTGEASIPLPKEVNQYSVILGAVPNISCPLYLLYDYCKPCVYPTQITRVPPKNICAIISSAGSDNRFRNIFIDELVKRGIHVDMGGSYKNNIGFNVPGSYAEQPIIDFLSQYRVVLALENTEQDHYITEKVINPLRSGTIPVYYGSKLITEYINSNRIVYIDPNNIDKAISKIKDLCENDSIWLHNANQFIFVKQTQERIDNVIAHMHNKLTTTDYIVNIIGDLDKEPERRESLKPIMTFYNNVSPNVTCYGEEASNHSFFNKFDQQKKINAISLAINHIQILEKYVNSNQYVVIFESDAIPVYPMEFIDCEIRKDIKTMREKHIDFAFIGFGSIKGITDKQKHLYKKLSESLWIPSNCAGNGASRCTEAYIASPNGIRSFMNWFNSTNNHDVIDWAFNKYFEQNNFAIGCWRSPELFKQGSYLGLYPSLVPI
jgi:hypothetical protein